MDGFSVSELSARDGAQSVSYRPLLSRIGVSCLTVSPMGLTEACREAGTKVCPEWSQLTDLMAVPLPDCFQVWEGLNVVKTGRMMLGETNPADSKPGTIRGDFCIQVGR